MTPRLRKFGRASGSRSLGVALSRRPASSGRGRGIAAAQHRIQSESKEAPEPLSRRAFSGLPEGFRAAMPPAKETGAPPGPAASPNRSMRSPSASTPRCRSTSGWPNSTSRARSPTPACSRARGILSARTSPPSSAAWRTIVRDEVRAGTFAWSIEREDVHLNIEHRLTELVGDAGKRLHTARSRNDQVATDLRLWLRAEIDAIRGLLRALRGAPARPGREARRDADAGLHAPAGRPAGDLRPPPDGLLRDVHPRRRAPRRLPPAGEPAAAGRRRARRHELPDRPRAVARELGFDGVCENSLDAVSDRDFAIEFLGAAALAMMHVSRSGRGAGDLDEPALRLRRLADRFCTGSSIMPQKKNPDVPGAHARQDRPGVRRRWWRCSR